MSKEQQIMVDRLFEALIAGDRPGARGVIRQCVLDGASADVVLADLCWPVYEEVENLYRSDRLTTIAHHMATRLLRVLCDQVAAGLEQTQSRGRSVFAVCGPTDADELAGQMAVDLLEHDGYAVRFAAGGIAADEILSHVQQERPDGLLLFASAPADLPDIRGLIDTVRAIGACDRMQLIVGGGVFNRADGLAEEIGADVWASSPRELVRVMHERPDQRAAANQRTVGKHKQQRTSRAA